MTRALAEPLRRHEWLVLFLGALAVGFLVYWPALDGPPISDDFGLLLNPWVTNPTPANLLALLDPFSDASNSLQNYAPVRALLNTLQWQLHPQVSIAYHGLNVVLHAAVSVLLVAFLQQTGISRSASIAAGAVFLLHPANVEAIAWMGQVWNPLALGFSLLALLCLWRRPGLATLFFSLALLSKPLAVFAPAAAAALAYGRSPGAPDAPPAGAATPPRWGVIGLWFVLTAAFAAAQLTAYGDVGPREHLHPDPLVAARSMATFALRYLVMAASAIGTSTFHEPPLAISWTDPWWLASLAVLLLLALRLVVTLRARRIEAAGWIWALAAFAPVSQIVPFLYPMSDRYLYFMLPGLLLAVCHAGRSWLAARPRDAAPRRAAGHAALAVAAALAIYFAFESHERARVWRSEDAVLADAARHYPDGVSAQILGARRAAREEDIDEVVVRIRRAADRGWDYWGLLLTHPDFAPVRTSARFRTLVEDLAAERIRSVARHHRPTQMELSDLASAHELRREIPEALAALDRALAIPGPLEEELRARRARLSRTPPAP